VRARAAAALAFVQGLRWRDDAPHVERYQSVARTLREGGNCHDRSPVLVALLLALGVPNARNAWLTQHDAPRNHVIAQVELDGAVCEAGVCRKGWCWAETTVDGARVCEDPYDALRRVEAGDANGAFGPSVPSDVVAPAPTGAPVYETTTRRQLPAPSGAPVVAPMLALGGPRRRVQPPAAPWYAAAPGPTPVPVDPAFVAPGASAGTIGLSPATVADLQRRAGLPDAVARATLAQDDVTPFARRIERAYARQPARFADLRERFVEGLADALDPSGDAGRDPCAATWSAVVVARNALVARPVPFPATGSVARLVRRDGRPAPDPAGASTGLAPAAWRAIPAQGWRARLTGILFAWAWGRGVDPATLDGGALYDWLNVALVRLAEAVDASAAGAAGALAAYRACRASGGIDAADALRRAGLSCDAWTRSGPAARRATVRSYLAGAGYDAALPDAAVDALAATVQRWCDAQAARAKSVATAPTPALARTVRA
jgi:hypothetical protein